MEALISESHRIYTTLNQYVTVSVLMQYVSVIFIAWLSYVSLFEPFLSPLRKIPGLAFNPIIGNMNEALKGQAMEATLKWLRKYGTIVRYYFFFGRERLVVADPEFMKHILVINSKNYIKPPNRLIILRKMVGIESVLLTEGATHAAQRKLMNPAFKYSSIKGMVRSFDRNSHKLCDKWIAEVRSTGQTEASKDIEIEVDLPRLTLDIIGECAFSYNFNNIDNPDSELCTAFHRILGGTGLSWKNIIPYYEYLPTTSNIRFKREISLITETVVDMIEKKRRVLSSSDHSSGGNSVADDLLGMLMSAQDENGQGMTDSCLRDQVLTFMLAGHETTATAMTWILHLLAENPDVQQKVRDEVAQVLPPRGEAISWDHLDQLKYLTCVIKETLRLCPPVPMTLRQTVHSDKLGKYNIPAGTIILVAIGPMMRLPQHFSEPDEFKPERFLEVSDESAANLYKFIPFLLGPRICIGYKFALAEMKTVLSVLLRDLVFSSVPGTTYKRKFQGTLKPAPRMMLRVSEVSG